MDFSHLKGKKLLILAGAGVHVKLVKAAKEMGIYTIVTDYLVDSPAKLIADESWMYSITDVENIVKRCKSEKVDGVIAFQIDPAQVPYFEICKQLGLPCYANRHSIEILTNKRKFKDYCLSHGVDVIPEYSLNDIESGNAEYPLFIKPSISRGSRGQTVAYNKEDALKGIEFAKSESKDGNFICEKYLKDNQDIGSAFFVIDGEPYLVKFADRFLGKESDNLNKQVICTMLPSSFSDTFEEKVQERVKSMIKSLNIDYGPVFLQGFVDGDTIRYYDPAQRMPGGDYDIVLEKAVGFSTYKSLINFALTGNKKFTVGDPENSYKLNGGISVLITISVRPGKIATVSGLDEIMKNKYVVYGRQIIEEGEVIPASGDIKQRVCAIGAYLPDKSFIPEYLNFLYSTYKVLDETGQNMIVSKYEY